LTGLMVTGRTVLARSRRSLFPGYIRISYGQSDVVQGEYPRDICSDVQKCAALRARWARFL
jgi:hypothetical protein